MEIVAPFQPPFLPGPRTVLHGVGGVVHAFTAASPEPPARFDRFAARVRTALAGSPAVPVVVLQQCHSARLLHLEHDSVPVPDADGVARAGACDGVTAAMEQPVMVAIQTADCVPVLAVDPELGAFAALHAGWRGTAAGILPNLLAHWQRAGSSLSAVRLAFGPAIAACCYEVGADCLDAFEPAHLIDAVVRHRDRTCLALTTVLRNQALAAGVAPRHVDRVARCTACHRLPDGTRPYASYRRDRSNGRALQHSNAALVGGSATR